MTTKKTAFSTEKATCTHAIDAYFLLASKKGKYTITDIKEEIEALREWLDIEKEGFMNDLCNLMNYYSREFYSLLDELEIEVEKSDIASFPLSLLSNKEEYDYFIIDDEDLKSYKDGFIFKRKFKR